MAQHFLEGRLSAFVEDAELLLAETAVTLSQVSLLINLAAAQYELGMYRKCIKSCEAAIGVAPQSLQAVKIWGKALVAQNKKSEAITLWENAVKSVDIMNCDMLIAREIRELIAANAAPSVTSVVDSIMAPNLATDSDTKPSSESDLKALGDAVADSKPSLKSGSPFKVQSKDSKCGSSIDENRVDTEADSKSSSGCSSPISPNKAMAFKPTEVKPLACNKTGLVDGADAETLIQSVQTFPEDNKIVITLNRSEEKAQPALITPHDSAIKDYYRTMKRAGDPAIMRAPLISAMKANLPHLTHHPDLDNLTALAYLEINSTHYDRALEILNFVLKHLRKAVSAWIGRGSIYAMRRQLKYAVEDFSEAIQHDKTVAEAWKRRAQTRAAMNQFKEGLSDLTKAIALAPKDAEVYYQRGLIHHQTHLYTRALTDYREAERLGYQSATLFNLIGQTEGLLGNIEASIASHTKALEQDENMKEAYINIGLMHKENGDASKALDYLERCIYLHTSPAHNPLGPNGEDASDKRPFYFIYVHKAQLLYQTGHMAKALTTIKIAINYLYSLHAVASTGPDAGTNPPLCPAASSMLRDASHQMLRHPANYLSWIRHELIMALHRAACCYQALGIYHKALVFYEQILKLHQNDVSFYHKEILLTLWEYLDHKIHTFNVDNVVHPMLKEGWCKGVPYNEYFFAHKQECEAYQPKKRPTDVSVCTIEDDDPDKESVEKLLFEALALVETSGEAEAADDTRVKELSESISRLPLMSQAQTLAIRSTEFYSHVVQLQCPGFLYNRRQRRMFGLAVLQVISAFKAHMDILCMEGSGLPVLDEAASADKRLHEGVELGVPPESALSSSSSSSRSRPKRQHGRSSRREGYAVAAVSSGSRVSGLSSHRFGWRDFFDVIVRWRQVAEPSDCVFYIDRMPLPAFVEGYGLQTPIISGVLKPVRYARFCSRALALVKACLGVPNALDAGHRETFADPGLYMSQEEKRRKITTDQLQRVQAADTPAAVLEAMGEGFYVTLPAMSVQSSFPAIFSELYQSVHGREPAPSGRPALALEGARITLLAATGEGVDFTVRTPGTPARFAAFTKELNAVFEAIEDLFLEIRRRQRGGGSGSAGDGDRDEAEAQGTREVPVEQLSEEAFKVLVGALALYYVWIVFSPLSRGSAICGLAALQSVLLAHGEVMLAGLLPNVQLDWEALLSTNLEAFVHKALRVVQLERIDRDQLRRLERCERLVFDEKTGCYSAALEAFSTLKDMIHALAIGYLDPRDTL